MFEEFGLNYYENKALETIIREQLTVKEIIKKSGIPPGKVYSVLKSLSRRRIISESKDRPKKFYVERPTKIISALIEEKQGKDEELISRARMFVSTLPKDDGQEYFFRIGTTPEDNKEIQLKAFMDAKKEVCQILNSKHKPNMNRKNKDEWEEAIKDAIHRGVKFRALYHKDTQVPESLTKLPKDKFIIRRTSNDMYRIDIIDNKKVLIKVVYDDPMMFGGLIYIENEKLAKNLKTIFEDMWKNSG
ncbi:MAG: TrmB family transcriptional regulator [Candidatus Woesearchaeota archaeon]